MQPWLSDIHVFNRAVTPHITILICIYLNALQCNVARVVTRKDGVVFGGEVSLQGDYCTS